MQINRIQNNRYINQNNIQFRGRVSNRSEKYFYDMVRHEISPKQQQQWLQLLEELKSKAAQMHKNTEIDISGYENKQIIATNNNVHITCDAAPTNNTAIEIGDFNALKKAIDSINPHKTDIEILEYAKHKLKSLIRLDDLFPNHPNDFAIKDLKKGIKTYETDLKNS